LSQDTLSHSEAEIAKFGRRVTELRLSLAGADPDFLARQTGCRLEFSSDGHRFFRVPLWSRELHFHYPELVAVDPAANRECALIHQALLLYYFSTADGSPPATKWVSFGELPDGRFYNQAFQGYTGAELARHYGSDQAAFERAAAQLGGVAEPVGDCAFLFRALPRVALLVVHWQGDEEFPSSFKILFDASASHYLPSDVCAVLGGMLAGRLVGADPRRLAINGSHNE
jgi:hypothetical protein